MAGSREAAARAARDDVERRIAQVEGRLHQREREDAGELTDVDQHAADLGSEVYDREQDVQRLEALRDQLRTLDDAVARPDAVPVPAGERLAPDPDDDTTPLDAVEEDPVDLGAIPMDQEDTIDKDPQDLDAPGSVYQDGDTEPDVGDPDDVDLDVDRRYRPE